MNVTLYDDDVQTPIGLLHDYLPELKFEAARRRSGAAAHPDQTSNIV
jgi:hypothetical protein